MKFAEMTFPELRAVSRDRIVVVAPVAACEQHSHHLATFTDPVLATGVAERVDAPRRGAAVALALVRRQPSPPSFRGHPQRSRRYPHRHADRPDRAAPR